MNFIGITAKLLLRIALKGIGGIFLTDKRGKRAVIINNIHSDAIEQAIFILKSESVKNRPGVGIIAEAQGIIDNYIKMTEGRPYRPKKKRSAALYISGAAICTFLTVLFILSRF